MYSCLANGSSDEFQKGEHLYKIKAVKEALQIGKNKNFFLLKNKDFNFWSINSQANGGIIELVLLSCTAKFHYGNLGLYRQRVFVGHVFVWYKN